MSRIKPIPLEKTEGNVSVILNDIQKTFGMVPNLFKVYAHHPGLLETNWNKVKTIMTQGVLSRKVKEVIALLVSRDNDCSYCVSAHTKALRSIGVEDDEIELFYKDLNQSNFTSKELSLILFARKSNGSPNQITDQEFESLTNTGATSEEIIEALGVMEIFTSFNKFLDSLNVAID